MKSSHICGTVHGKRHVLVQRCAHSQERLEKTNFSSVADLEALHKQGMKARKIVSSWQIVDEPHYTQKSFQQRLEYLLLKAFKNVSAQPLADHLANRT